MARVIYRGYHIRAHVLLNLLNEFNKFNNSGAQMLDSIYHMTLKLIKIAFWRKNVMILPYFTQRFNGLHTVMIRNL